MKLKGERAYVDDTGKVLHLRQTVLDHLCPTKLEEVDNAWEVSRVFGHVHIPEHHRLILGIGFEGTVRAAVRRMRSLVLVFRR